MHVSGLPLPEVFFTTHPQVGLALVEDKVSQAYGYNDGKSWIGVEGEGQYLRWIRESCFSNLLFRNLRLNFVTEPMESDQSKQVEYDMDEQGKILPI